MSCLRDSSSRAVSPQDEADKITEASLTSSRGGTKKAPPLIPSNSVRMAGGSVLLPCPEWHVANTKALRSLRSALNRRRTSSRRIPVRDTSRMRVSCATR